MKPVKKNISVLISVVALLVSVLAFTGCESKTQTQPQSLSMVLGIHRYFPEISLNTESVYEQIYQACYTWGDVSAVISDGSPFVACNYNIKETDKKIDKAKRKQLAKENSSQIISDLSADHIAKTPEIDTLSAIALSSKTLKSSNDGSHKRMLIIDSGLSTTSLLNFASQNLFDASANEVVEQLKQLHALPDLTEIEVTWIGLGETCGEQSALTSDYQYKLQTLWQTILSASGASAVKFDTSPLSSDKYDGSRFPECKTVPVVTDSLNLASVVSKDNLPEVIKFDENSIRFKADSSEFSDEKAGETLTPIAEYLIQNPTQKMYIVGMTATIGDEESGKKLSLDRAAMCKSTLINKGVSEDQMICVGLGRAENPLRAIDVDSNGNLIEEKAQLNRAVFFIQNDSKLVNELKL